MCYSCRGFLIKHSIFDIREGSEYALISEYTRVLNILRVLNMSGLYIKFWIKYFLIEVWQYSGSALDSKYATVLNILGLRKVVNKIFHHRYLTESSTCLEFWIYQCYTRFCRKQPVIHVWQVSEYSLGS